MVTYLVGVEDDDRVFKALADPTRRRLLDRLFERAGLSLTELESELAMTRFGVAKPLRVLEEARPARRRRPRRPGRPAGPAHRRRGPLLHRRYGHRRPRDPARGATGGACRGFDG